MAEVVKACGGDALSAFLAHNASQPWSPGSEIDCCLVLAEWAIWLGHPDPAAWLRGTYEQGQGQIDALITGGGAVALVERCAMSIGGVPVDCPRRGDIGVVGSSKLITRQFGVIHDGNGWLTRTRDGFVPVTAKTLSAWKI
ncbi:hypothetical protein [Neorhizobium sp. NCHU2750]|uniref:DUF6950 family protein n=1 Tax=Neorhizobium sp. NCHU2750 TaxID=1825976 RepID=UPI000EB6C100|nr:hypothetical protein NCHU2750_06350 [Neorhizobium sp. NCHU2750]